LTRMSGPAVIDSWNIHRAASGSSEPSSDNQVNNNKWLAVLNHSLIDHSLSKFAPHMSSSCSSQSPLTWRRRNILREYPSTLKKGYFSGNTFRRELHCDVSPSPPNL
jgi:hypothetical protein